MALQDLLCNTVLYGINFQRDRGSQKGVLPVSMNKQIKQVQINYDHID